MDGLVVIYLGLCVFFLPVTFIAVVASTILAWQGTRDGSGEAFDT